MTMYNLIFGKNSLSQLLLSTLNLTENDVPRYRDCCIDGDKILVYTRVGGGNRPYYDNVESLKSQFGSDIDDDECHGPFSDDLRKHPDFLYDEDDEMDRTYCSFYFSFPEEYKEELTELAKKVKTVTPSKQWETLLNLLKSDEQGEKQ